MFLLLALSRHQSGTKAWPLSILHAAIVLVKTPTILFCFSSELPKGLSPYYSASQSPKGNPKFKSRVCAGSARLPIRRSSRRSSFGGKLRCEAGPHLNSYGSPTRRIRLAKRGSERILSQINSTFRKTNPTRRSLKARSKASNALSALPRFA